MAYGTVETTLENFDAIIPDEVCEEVTSISLAQFRFLRDGGSYINEQTGKEEMFEGKLFDSVIFNDSLKEFLDLIIDLQIILMKAAQRIFLTTFHLRK